MKAIRMKAYCLCLASTVAIVGCTDEFAPDSASTAPDYSRFLRNNDGSYSCTPTNRGQDVEADVIAMRNIAQVVSPNESDYFEASFDGGHRFVYVPAGPFAMGTENWGTDESPSHTVQLSGYWVGKNFVTNDQFETFVDETGYVTDAEKPGAEGCYVFVKHSLRPGGDWTPTPGRNWRNPFIDHPTDSFYREFDNLGDHPVGCVSWYDAEAYGDWLSEKIGLNIALPTEAQWEKAARGDDGRAWPWGNEPPDAIRSNFADAAFDSAYEQPNQGEPDNSVDDGWSATSPIGAFPAGASPYGVMDMGGNTTAWVYDVPRQYSYGPINDPIGEAPEADRTDREMRGGFWISSRGTLTPSQSEINIKHTTRSDLRAQDDPRSSDDHLGFRVAIDYCDR